MCCLRNFHRQLQYSQVDRSEWVMATGLVQWRPASPDLMNILFEPSHRCTAAQKKAVAVADTFVASASFAGDAALMAVSFKKAQFPTSGCQAWCDLLRIKLNVRKTEIWRN